MQQPTAISASSRAAVPARVRGRLGLSVAARNFAGVPRRDSLAAISRIGFDTIDKFDWRNPQEFGEYKRLLVEFGLSAGVLVVNKKPHVNALGCSLVGPDDRSGF